MFGEKHFPARFLLFWMTGFLSLPLARGQNSSWKETDRGIELQVGKATVQLAVATPTAFRLSISFSGKPRISASTFLAPEVKDDHTPWQVVHQGGLVGISSAAGELLIDPQTGKWTLQDAHGGTLIPPSSLGAPAQVTLSNKTSVPGIDLTVAWKDGAPIKVYGCGDGPATLQQTDDETRVGNGTAVIPYYWSTSGYAALAVTSDDNTPASWTAATDQSSGTWHFPGSTADLYLMSAPSLEAAAKDYAQLSGFAPVPPLWTFGYLQSRWGWKDRADIEDVLHQFLALHIPVDAFIFDFEWYAVNPDYKLPSQGTADFADFGWNPLLFPEPSEQLAAYRKEGIHFVGIRKPRMGNTDTLNFLRGKGWMLPFAPGKDEGYHGRDVDFANPDFRSWYEKESQPLLHAGVNGWWNDEGESTYTTFYHWNEAERAAFAVADPGQRFWSINRSFSPGTQRLGATVWTGDVKSGWNFFQKTCTDLLNYSLAGMPFCGCDIGGFKNRKEEPPLSPELLTRWMEAGVFFPIMRTHSSHNVTPHFPWLFGAEAQAAITKAIDLRYRLIPYYYSLAYETHETGVPMMRPLVMDYPDDAAVANLSDQWTMGAGLMVAPVVQEGAVSRSVYLPHDRWFAFETGTALEGGQTIPATAKLDEIPLYVRAGTILPLGPVVQNTGELPGGPLNLEVYPGKNATFTLVEDDGETTDYLKGAFRKTLFKWDDAGRKLSWTTTGSYSGPHLFQQLTVSLFTPTGKKSGKASLTAPGSLQISSDSF